MRPRPTGPSGVVVPAPYDPWEPAVVADPYPSYATLRAGGGCHFVPARNMWVLSSHDHVRAALADQRRFSSADGVSLPAASLFPGSGWIFEDPPSHTRTRALAAPVFSRASTATHAPAVRAMALEAVDRFVSARGGDVVTALAQPMAVAALCAILGVPDDMPHAMAAMSEGVFVGISAPTVDDRPKDLDQRGLELGVRLFELIEDRIERAAGSPQDPPTTMLDAIISHAGEQAGFVTLDAAGRAHYLASLVSPGVETVRSLIGNLIELAANHPWTWQAVRADRIAPQQLVDEVLRYESPIQGFFRGTTCDVPITSAITIPTGSRVLCLFGSANRDETVFTDADTFDPHREDARRHLAFGAGIHRCLGAWLAELEVTSIVRALAERVSAFHVTAGERAHDMALLRSWKRMEVTIEVT